MEAIFRRLTAFLAVLSFVGFGVASCYSYWMSYEFGKRIEYWENEIQNHSQACEREKPTERYFTCPRADNYRELAWKLKMLALDERDMHREGAPTYLWLCVLSPIFLLCVFHIVLWILTGKKPKFGWGFLRSTSPPCNSQTDVEKPPSVTKEELPEAFRQGRDPNAPGLAIKSVHETKKEHRLKWLWWFAGLSVVALSFMINTERAFGALIRTLVQVAIVVPLIWLATRKKK